MVEEGAAAEEGQTVPTGQSGESLASDGGGRVAPCHWLQRSDCLMTADWWVPSQPQE